MPMKSLRRHWISPAKLIHWSRCAISLRSGRHCCRRTTGQRDQQRTVRNADAEGDERIRRCAVSDVAGVIPITGEFQSLAVGLFETAHERSSNFLTSMLTRTRSFKENMADLFSSLTQSIIKNLVDMAAQALVTSSVMQTIMGVVGAGVALSRVLRAQARGLRFRMRVITLSFNAKGGVSILLH
jgi:hypothetical protein